MINSFRLISIIAKLIGGRELENRLKSAGLFPLRVLYSPTPGHENKTVGIKKPHLSWRASL